MFTWWECRIVYTISACGKSWDLKGKPNVCCNNTLRAITCNIAVLCSGKLNYVSQSDPKCNKEMNTLTDIHKQLAFLIKYKKYKWYIMSSIPYWSTQHAVGLYWIPGHCGVRENEIVNDLARGGSALKFVGPEPALGVSRQDIQRRIRCW